MATQYDENGNPIYTPNTQAVGNTTSGTGGIGGFNVFNSANPQGANLGTVGLQNTSAINPLTNAGNLTQGQQQSQAGLAAQNAWANALAQNNGALNLGSTFGQVTGVTNQEQDLANQLQAQSLGGGPNPALAQLAQTTGQNVNQQAALMAGQRGASQNVGLMARQQAQQGANIQQQAVGQAATMRAQQQLAAEQLLQGQQGIQTGTLGQQAGIAQGMVTNQSNAVNAAAQNAANLQQMQLNAMNQQNATSQQQQQMALEQQMGLNQNNVSMQGNINTTGAQIAAGNAQTSSGILGGVLGAAGSVLGFLNKGGVVQHFDDGGMAQPISQTTATSANSNGPKSKAGQFLSKVLSGAQAGSTGSSAAAGSSPLQTGMTQFGSGIGNAMNSLFSKSPGSTGAPILMGNTAGVGNPTMIAQPAVFGSKGGQINMVQGGNVPGQAQVAGDSQKNDTVPAMLSPGEVVIPRSIVKSKNAPKKAANFMEAVLSRRN